MTTQQDPPSRFSLISIRTWPNWRWLIVAMLSAVGVIVYALSGRRRGTDWMDSAQAEIRAIEAERGVRDMEAKTTHAERVDQVQKSYAKEMAALERRSHRQALMLRQDPRKLARALARLSKSKLS